MIRSYFGITQNPFVIDETQPLLPHQQRHFDILKVHSQQGGLCLILGEPGTGKTVLKNAIIHHNPKQWITPIINRALHTWPSLLRLLCQAMQVDINGNDHRCETRLIAEARNLNNRRCAPFLFWKLIRFQFPSSMTPISSPQKHSTNSACC
jgi:type II secretory pathway predicted ATPase ExeA